jgi:hypothetical protein
VLVGTNSTGYAVDTENPKDTLPTELGCATGANPVNGVCPSACVAGAVGSLNLISAYATGPQTGSALASKIIPDGAFSSATGGLYPVTYCSAGCEIQPSGLPQNATVDKTVSANGYYAVRLNGVPMSKNGASCTASATASPVASSGSTFPDPTISPPTPTTANTSTNGACPSGTVAMGQDPYGMTICQGKTTAPSAQSPTSNVTGASSTVTNSDGSTTTTQTSTSLNADGSTTTTVKTTTTGTDGSTKVSTTSSTGNTPSGSQGTQDNPNTQNDLCKLHPELNICQNSQVQGTCGTITCTGDAIQCATLRAAAQMQCQQQQDEANIAAMKETTLGNSIMAGSDPMQAQIAANQAGTSVDLSNPGANMDSNGFLAAGSCLADRSINVLGRSVTISFSKLCPALGTARQVIIAIASLIFCFIVIGSFTFSANGDLVDM